MSDLLEIAGEDIAALGDAQLRDLIGLLCEADYRRAGLPCSGITWGGHQDVSDGGLDVRVRGDVPPPPNSFVPRATTGFQVKKSKMPPASIQAEMCPKGALRKSIKDLIAAKGSYVLVSSGDSTTDSMLRTRVDTMHAAVASEDGADRSQLVFLDRGRIATWLREHPSLVLRVRKEIGRPLAGWSPYDNWANAPGGVEEEYISDDQTRLCDRRSRSAEGVPIEDGLLQLRRLLSAPRSCVRLAGLAGVGKTRLVQALFDERLSTDALDRTLACYADMSSKPAPHPVAMAEQLISARRPAIVVVDNCPPELHEQLARRCAQPDSKIRILTIEYDVRDDLPEETSVFLLEPASAKVIEQVVSRRFAHITPVDARTIAKFSGGNARIAISLANTVRADETLSGLRDNQLFNRLFWQRDAPDHGLQTSAQLCSLVYSFEGTDTRSEKSELRLLGSLGQTSARELYRDVAALQERDLVQSRDVWRAVLPQAIADRLARRALESIPKDEIARTFLHSGSKRLLRSFTRRLSCLHDCEHAVAIVRDWLRSDGWIGSDVVSLDAFGVDVLTNIAPVCPAETLSAIERASLVEGFTSKGNLQRERFIRLLRSIAYEPSLFERSATVLSRFALSELHQNNRGFARVELASLFHAYYSGTKASIQERASFIEGMVDADEAERQEIGLHLLSAALEAWRFMPSSRYSFGARSRDFGYQPETREDSDRWYTTFLAIGTRLALSGRPISFGARNVLAENLRGLWRGTAILDALEDAAQRIHSSSAWNEGWVAVREIIRYDGERLSSERRDRLGSLEQLLKPAKLIDRARTFAFSGHLRTFDLEDDFDESEQQSKSGFQRACDTTRRIAMEVAQDETTLVALLPDLVSSHGARLEAFGEGLAEGSTRRHDLWRRLRAALAETGTNEQKITAMRGFLSRCATIDPKLRDAILDDVIDDDILGPWFPHLQTTASLDARALARLHRCLDLGRAHVNSFQHLAFGRLHQGLNDSQLAGLLDRIVAEQGGADVAIEILHMRLHGTDPAETQQSHELLAVGRRLLCSISFAKEARVGGRAHDVTLIAEACLAGRDAEDAAREVCSRLANCLAGESASALDWSNLLVSLASTHPRAFLDVFLVQQDDDRWRFSQLFALSRDLERYGSPLDRIPDADLLAWCDEDPEPRYPLMVESVHLFTVANDGSVPTWRPILAKIFGRAPNLQAVLDGLSDSITPSSWNGSRAEILAKRLVLFESLFEHENRQVQAWARNQFDSLTAQIAREREREDQRRRAASESFE